MMVEFDKVMNRDKFAYWQLRLFHMTKEELNIALNWFKENGYFSSEDVMIGWYNRPLFDSNIYSLNCSTTDDECASAFKLRWT